MTLRPALPAPARAGLRAAQPRVAAAHLRRRRLRHGDARLGRARTATSRRPSARSSSSPRTADRGATLARRDGERFPRRGRRAGRRSASSRRSRSTISPRSTCGRTCYENLPLAQPEGALRRDHGERLQRQPVHRLAGPAVQPGLGEEPRGERRRRSTAPDGVLRRHARDAEPAPDRRHRAENCTEQLGVPGPVARAAAALPDGLHAEQRRGAAERVLRPARARGRRACALQQLRDADRAAPADLRDPHDRRRRALDEPVLPAGVASRSTSRGRRTGPP